MKSKLLIGLLVFEIMLISCSVIYAEDMELVYDGKSHSYSGKTIHLYIDNEEIQTTAMPPIQLNGCTLIPAKEVFVNTGAEVEWRSSEKSVYISKEDLLIVLKVDDDIAWVNGEHKKMAMPAKIINNKVMIPLRFIGEALGYNVLWQPEEPSVSILTKSEEQSQNNDINHIFNWETEENTSTDMLNNIANIDPTHTNQSTDTNPNSSADTNIDTSVNTNMEITDFNNFTPDMDLNTIFGNENISYLWGEGTFTLKQLDGLQAAKVTCEEDPYTKQIIVNLNQDYSGYLSEGYYTISDSEIESMQIVHQMGSTQLIIKTSKIKALLLSDIEGQLHMKVVTPSEKYNKIVVVDAGHGAGDPGTTGNGIKEKDLNLALSQQLVSVLEADPEIKVYATRRDDTFVELEGRSAFSNEINPDLFISIHINSSDANPSASGTETYYTTKQDTRNKIFADIVQNALVSEFGTRNRGVKHNTFVVTRCTDAPAILIEIGFLSNASDFEMMTSWDFTTRYAGAVYRSILEYYNQGYDY